MTNGICCASFRNEESTVICQSNQYASESSNIDNSERITAYISIRSPYSYLGWIKLRRLAEKYQATIEVKPVLPLKMQGHQVSRKKAIYIMLDTMRHCQQLNIPFAQFNDPLGSGVEHCYQLFSYANSVGKGVAFFDVMFRAVYHSGIDLSLSTNLIKLCQDIGIDYEAALMHNEKNPWQSMVEQHLIDLKQLNFWGVPCFQYHDEVVWGQDRLYRIETALQKRAK